MSWSIPDKTLLSLIKGLNEAEKNLFISYQEFKSEIDTISEYELVINESIMYLNYFDDQLQDTSHISKEIVQMELLIKNTIEETERLESCMSVIEKSLSSSSLGKVKFLDHYKVEYDQAHNLLRLCDKEMVPEDFISGNHSVIAAFCELIWNNDRGI